MDAGEVYGKNDTVDKVTKGRMSWRSGVVITRVRVSDEALP